MKQTIISKIEKELEKAQRICILTHTNPDGDAIGSALGLYHWLKGKGKQVVAGVPTIYPKFLSWMPGIKEMIIGEEDLCSGQRSINEADLIICVDFNAADRLDDLQPAFEASKAIKLLIDHHIEREHFCDLEYTTTQVSSTAELIYRLINELGAGHTFTKEIGICLYVGIMTDTGSFSFACNYPGTFQAASEIIALGVDGEQIHRLVYDTYSENRIRLLGYCLSEKMVVMTEYATAYIALSAEELDRFEAKNGDTEGVVNYTLGINGIVFGALITERNGRIKVSLRSKGNFNVNQIAVRHFNGGGHKNAAGGDLYCSFEEAVKLFRTIVPMYHDDLKKAEY